MPVIERVRLQNDLNFRPLVGEQLIQFTDSMSHDAALSPCPKEQGLKADLSVQKKRFFEKA